MDDLCCAVCGQQAFGQHFGVVCCRACAAFFRRWLDNKPNYKCTGGSKKCSVRTEASRTACKACRLAACQKAGLREKHADLSDFDGTGYSSALHYLQKRPKNLRILAEAHQTLVEHQMSGKFRQSTKRNLFDLFNHAMKPFANLEAGSKADLFESCARQLHILHRCCLIICRSNGTEPMCSPASNYFDQFAQRLASFPCPPSQFDFCALMALSLCTKVKLREDLDFVATEKWKSHMNYLLSEWFIDLCTRMGSTNYANIQMARLIATLPQLEEIASSGQFSDIVEDNDELQESKSTELMTMTGYTSFVGFDFQIELKEDLQMLDHWSRLLGAHNRIWGAYNELDLSYLHITDDFNRMLDSHDNILGMAEQFTLHPPVLNEYEKAAFYSELNEFHQHPRIRKAIVVSQLLMVGILKAMPAFVCLARQDRETMVHYHYHITPLNFFIYAYHSALLGADTQSAKDGLNATETFRAYKRYAGDENLVQLIQQAYSTRPFTNGAPLPDPEEMGLLIAIHCSFPTIPKLSAGAQALLYAEQSRYSKMLLRHLQRQLGPDAGVRRYAECLFLLNYPFSCARRHDLFKIYIETFHLRRDYNATIIPRVCPN